MCLLLFAWRPSSPARLVVAANRDEFHARPTSSAALQPEGWLGGRDLLAGGTWLGVAPGGRFAALTNVREPNRPRPPDAPTRGDLVRGFLEGEVAALDYLRTIAGDRYAGFNLIVADGETAAYLGNRAAGGPRHLTPGLYGLSNALLDTPWPKVRSGKAALEAVVSTPQVTDPALEALLETVADRALAPDPELPDTGVGLELERLLSPRFLVGDPYGTRCSTAVRIAQDGAVTLLERRFAPDGTPAGETRLEVRARGALP